MKTVTNITDAPAYRAIGVLRPKVGDIAARLAVSLVIKGQGSDLEKWKTLMDCGLTAHQAGDLMRSLGVEHAASICPECRRPIDKRETCARDVETNELRHGGCAYGI